MTAASALTPTDPGGQESRATAACPVCGRNARPWGEVDGTPVLRCTGRDCGFGFFDLERWRSPYVEKDYYSEWTPRQPNFAAPWIRARVRMMSRFKPAGVVAELGCGVGETAIALARRGFAVVAVEESAKAIDYLKVKFPVVDWRNENVLEFLRGHHSAFDSITMFHVLEHIPHPEELMRLVDNALKPDGVIAIEVPDVGGGLARLQGWKWDYFIQHHVNYFDTRSLAKLMARFGYRRRFLERTYHFSFPQGHLLKDLIKGALGRLGLNSIIRTVWSK